MAATGPVHADGLKDAALMLATVSSHRSGLGKILWFVVLIWCAGLSSAYAFAFVTDANATTRLSTPAGGGSNNLLVFTTNNGTDWLIL